MTHARKLTRLMLAVTSMAGAGLAAGALAAPAAAVPPVSLSETWNTATAGTILNDAPCGVAEASPVLFNDGGTPAVEVGDRQGALYGLNLQTGSVVPGWGGGTGSTIGSGQGCSNGNPGGGSPATGVNGIEVPGSPPIDSTASVSGNGNLYFGAGNAASPVDGGYYSYAPNGGELWNQVVTNPSTDPAPDGGVQASLPLARRRIARRGWLAGPDDVRAQQRRAVRPQPVGRSSPPTACSPPRPSVTSTARARTTSSPAVRRRPVSPSARTTPTAATCASTTTTAA